MSTTTDLMGWLREQIAEDKRSLDTRERHDCDDAAHAIWTDERVLAQCEAHTEILTLHEKNEPGRWTPRAYCACQAEDGMVYGEWPCDTLKFLAFAYQHRPGYREEWRP